MTDLELLQAELATRPRRHGYYLVRMVAREHRSLDEVFALLDDQTWPPVSGSPDHDWDGHQIDEAEATTLAVEALVGGHHIGHTHDTIPAAQAEALWRRFRGLFAAQARCYGRLGLGDPSYVFQLGAAVVDDHHAGVLAVVEDD